MMLGMESNPSHAKLLLFLHLLALGLWWLAFAGLAVKFNQILFTDLLSTGPWLSFTPEFQLMLKRLVLLAAGLWAFLSSVGVQVSAVALLRPSRLGYVLVVLLGLLHLWSGAFTLLGLVVLILCFSQQMRDSYGQAPWKPPAPVALGLVSLAVMVVGLLAFGWSRVAGHLELDRPKVVDLADELVPGSSELGFYGNLALRFPGLRAVVLQQPDYGNLVLVEVGDSVGSASPSVFQSEDPAKLLLFPWGQRKLWTLRSVKDDGKVVFMTFLKDGDRTLILIYETSTNDSERAGESLKQLRPTGRPLLSVGEGAAAEGPEGP